MNTDAALRALAEPQRRRILEVVGDRDLPAGEIAEHFEILDLCHRSCPTSATCGDTDRRRSARWR